MNATQPKHQNGRPQEYRGPLTAAQIAEGMNAARRNARRLATDARILLEAERLPTAAAMAALSIEESGKTSILRELATATSPDAIKAAWRRYRDHRSKNGAWILPDLARAGAKHLFELRPTVDRNGEHTALLNSLKQLGFYTDCYGNRHWSEPIKIFEGKEESLAYYLVKTAELLARDEETTVREIELWIEHMQPVWLTAEMPHALLRFAEAMHRERLSTTTQQEYAQFVFGELQASEQNAGPSEDH
jgi:AbiV family abortive infection protein